MFYKDVKPFRLNSPPGRGLTDREGEGAWEEEEEETNHRHEENNRVSPSKKHSCGRIWDFQSG